MAAVLAAASMLVSGSAYAQTVWPGAAWERVSPADAGLNQEKLIAAQDYATTVEGAGFITRGGRLVTSWGDETTLYDLKSSSKSIGFTAMGLAILDGKLSLSDRAVDCHPQFGVPPAENQSNPWRGRIKLLHLATHTAGFEKPGGYTKLFFEPGTKWAYSDGGPNWLAECLTLTYRKDIQELLFERVFNHLGIGRDDLRWRTNQYRAAQIDGIERREFGSGVHANVDAMARIGYLYLRGGEWDGRQLLPSAFVKQVARPPDLLGSVSNADEEHYPQAPAHYGLLWWNNADGTLANVPRDAFWSWGLHDSLIVVIPSLDIAISRAGQGWQDGWGAGYARLAPFLNSIVAAATMRPPYPPSPVITGIEWAPPESIIRKAAGSDNWPLTWADDGHQYTAYGDGWGFKPKVELKLSLGLSRIEGPPDKFRGVNIRSPSIEKIGQGAAGLKASGMLMVEGVLYMWMRNAANSVLTWSGDHGRTWKEADWKFVSSFGAPTFLNFGKNYEGARDSFVYIYSHDRDSAYEPADRMILARVEKTSIRDHNAYEYFAGIDSAGQPRWSDSADNRATVFDHPGRAYRSDITYNQPLQRYLWCQIIPVGDTRFAGGFGVYDAPEPWGPWTTVYFTDKWDVGPGETCSFPTQWISPDGKTLHMVFSGDDAFSVRRATLSTSKP
ncbi:MAG: serine hydrolase [Acidobacteria bacterium]|nr:serine hydrolase [Acidobacteriota bacterium]